MQMKTIHMELASNPSQSINQHVVCVCYTLVYLE